MDAKLQDHSQAADQTSRPDIFISRAGADQIIATNIAQLLEQAGHKVIIQDWDFQNRNFAERMDAALSSGARVIALLSPDYLASDACKAEYLNILAADPLNNTGRLIVMRVSECEPVGLLRGIAYWDLVPLREMSEAAQEQISRDIVLSAANPAQRTAMPLDQYWRPARAILHRNIRNTPNFTGRDAALLDLDEALWSVHSAQPLTNGHDTTITAAAITQATIAHGLGGIGKTTLARQYGFDAQSGYAGVWWLHAQRGAGGAKDDAGDTAGASVDAASGWSGVIEGLIELGALFIRGLDQAQDRAAAARRTLDFLAHAGFEKPWLLIFDNVDDTSVLRHWGPPGDAGGAIQVLMTTRVSGWSAAVKRVEVEELPLQDAAMFLVRDSGRPDLGAEGAIELARTLGCLPLALSHASAYLRRRQTVTPTAYLQALQRHMSDAPKGAEYDRSVFATFLAAAEQAEEDADGAAAILALAAFFGPDDVPVELFEQDPELYPDVISIVLTLPGQLDEALGALAHFSLIDYDAATRTFSLHRLVQAATRDALADEETRALSASAVKVMCAAFPEPEFANWPQCARLIDHAEHLFKLVDDDVAPEELANLLGKAAYFLEDQAAYDATEPLYLRSLTIEEKRLGPDHEDVAVTLNNLAALYYAQGRFDEAPSHYKRSLTIREKALGPDHPDVAQTLNNLAELYRAQGLFDKAEPLLKRALTIQEKALGPDHEDVAVTLNNLAALYYAQGRFDEAESHYKRGLTIVEEALGPEHPDVGSNLNNLAELYRAQGLFDKAEPIYRRALSIWETALGPNHPLIGNACNNLALLYLAQGLYNQAEPLYNRALSILEAALGSDHPNVGQACNNLAGLYQAQGLNDKAEPLFNRALTIQEKALGPDHPDVAQTLNNLAALYQTQGLFDKAEPLIKRALSIWEAALGPDHPLISNACNNLAHLMAQTGRLPEALPLSRHAVAIMLAAVGPDHPDTKTMQDILAHIETALASAENR